MNNIGNYRVTRVIRVIRDSRVIRVRWSIRDIASMRDNWVIRVIRDIRSIMHVMVLRNTRLEILARGIRHRCVVSDTRNIGDTKHNRDIRLLDY